MKNSRHTQQQNMLKYMSGGYECPWWAIFMHFSSSSLHSSFTPWSRMNMCSHSGFCFSFSSQHATWKQGLQGEQWGERCVLNGPVMNHCCRCWMGALFGGVSVKVIYGPIRVGVLTCGLFWCTRRRSGRMVLWPLDVPAEVRHLHVAPDHEGAGQVEAVLRVGSD